jgi:hypothetical protein
MLYICFEGATNMLSLLLTHSTKVIVSVCSAGAQRCSSHLPSPPFAFLCEPDATLRKDDRP